MATVKGTWRFNDVLTVPNINFDVKVVFITPGDDSHKWYGIRHFNESHGIAYRDSDLSAWIQYLFEPFAGDVGWIHPERRTIVFETEQEVSDDFYEWFTANASPYVKTKTFKKLYIGDVVAANGARALRKLTTKQPVVTLTAGLFDENDNLVADWDTLVNTYGLNIEKDYNMNTYKTDKASLYCVLENNIQLSTGTKLVIADDVTVIGNFALFYCDGIKSLTVGKGVKAIGIYAMCGSGLKEVIIPEGVTGIYGYAFYGCGNIENVVLPDSANLMDVGVFAYCSKLKSVTIGKGVTQIPNATFVNCKSLKDVYYRGTAEEWAAITIGTGNEYLTNATIHYNYTG